MAGSHHGKFSFRIGWLKTTIKNGMFYQRLMKISVWCFTPKFFAWAKNHTKIDDFSQWIIYDHHFGLLNFHAKNQGEPLIFRIRIPLLMVKFSIKIHEFPMILPYYPLDIQLIPLNDKLLRNRDTLPRVIALKPVINGYKWRFLWGYHSKDGIIIVGLV